MDVIYTLSLKTLAEYEQKCTTEKIVLPKSANSLAIGNIVKLYGDSKIFWAIIEKKLHGETEEEVLYIARIDSRISTTSGYSYGSKIQVRPENILEIA